MGERAPGPVAFRVRGCHFRMGLAFRLAWTLLCRGRAGLGYLRRNPGIYGKKPDGTLPWWSWGLFLPLHLFTLAVWHLFRLWIGRRLLAHEFPSEVQTIVDLTSEFGEPQRLVTGRRYLSFPILEAATPDPRQLMEFISSLPDDLIYVHCAQGPGRTGVFAMACLILLTP